MLEVLIVLNKIVNIYIIEDEGINLLLVFFDVFLMEGRDDCRLILRIFEFK